MTTDIKTSAREILTALRFQDNTSHMQPATPQTYTYEMRRTPKRIPGDAEWALKQIISGPSHRWDDTPYEGEVVNLVACSLLLALARPDLGEVKRVVNGGEHYSTWHTDKGSVQVGTRWCNVERDGIRLNMGSARDALEGKNDSVLIPWSNIA
jgi:hypothetical protein